MLGVGKWKCNISSMVFKGEIILSIQYNNGQYELDIDVPGKEVPEFKIKDLSVSGNEMNFKVESKELNGNNLDVNLLFETERTFSGSVKVPFMGKMKIKDGTKID